MIHLIYHGCRTGYIHETATTEMFDKDVNINFKSILLTANMLCRMRKNEEVQLLNFSAVSAAAMGMLGL